ncbi:MAG: hypothetical protein ACRDGO_01415 [Actinomycetota bacterium]
MTERWQRELTKLRGGAPPDDLWDRVGEGPRMEPIGEPRRSRIAAVFALRAFGSLGGVDRTFTGPEVLSVPAVGETAPTFLPDGRPIFVVHHEDGTLSVVDAFSPHRAFGFEELVVWCPTTRHFVEWAHEAHFDERGAWHSAGPAPESLVAYRFEVVARDANGAPRQIRVGDPLPPDPTRSASETSPDRPPFCPPDDAFVTHSIDPATIYDEPVDALADAPEGWVAVRGTLHVDDGDAFTQLCAEVADGACVNGVPVRGLDTVRFLLEIIRKYPGETGYDEPQVWLVRVRDGLIDDPAIAGFLNGAGSGVHG